jgi:DNA polymerase-4
MSSIAVWPRVIAHCDLDQFYAAVEALDFPELKGKPVIVGGLPGGRGVVSTASYEARRFGVHSAMPSGRAAHLCPQAVWRVPRMERYMEKSREVRAVLERFTDLIEPLSLDEAFLDLTGSQQLFGPPLKIARRIKDEVLRETGLVISVGVAANKFLAKLASDLKKPDGLVVAPLEQKAIEQFLAPLPVSRLWGAGPKTCECLNKLGFATIGQLARAEADWLARRLGRQAAEHLRALARGCDAREVETEGRAKSLSSESTFAKDLHDLESMERELLAAAEEVARRLRESRLRCLGVTLKLRLADFTRLTRAESFTEPVDLAEPLYEAAARMLRTRVNLCGQGVRLLGIAATRLLGESESAGTLFPDEHVAKRRKLAQAVDSLREKLGADSVKRGSLLQGRERNTGTPNG